MREYNIIYPSLTYTLSNFFPSIKMKIGAKNKGQTRDVGAEESAAPGRKGEYKGHTVVGESNETRRAR